MAEGQGYFGQTEQTNITVHLKEDWQGTYIGIYGRLSENETQRKEEMKRGDEKERKGGR